MPFCGHATIAALAGSATDAPDPLADTMHRRQPNARTAAFFNDLIAEMAQELLGNP